MVRMSLKKSSYKYTLKVIRIQKVYKRHYYQGRYRRVLGAVRVIERTYHRYMTIKKERSHQAARWTITLLLDSAWKQIDTTHQSRQALLIQKVVRMHQLK